MNSGAGSEARRERNYRRALAAVLLLGAIHRLAYVVFQARHDPTYARPFFDAAYYVDWARQLVEGLAGPQGAYYLAPLYPHLLALHFAWFGERFGLLYLGQHLLSLGTALLLAGVARRAAGRGAGLATAALFLVYQPWLYFASRPMGEAAAAFLLAVSLALVPRGGGGNLAAGVCSGLAVLGRPNLLLVPLAWIAQQGLARSRLRAGMLALGLLLVVAPVALRNHAVSGHVVPVSSNSGLTLFHGNGPGARGVYTPPAGFSGDVAAQREEATRLARKETGRALDEVEADRFWASRALATRLGHPGDSIVLLGRRVLLLLGSHEVGLDYHPALDPNPLRPTFRLAGEIPLVPFGLLVGLAALGLIHAGVRGSGGGPLWGSLLACAVTPLVFYVSSRYRLPVAAMLTVPAGCGLVGWMREPRRSRRWAGAGVILLALAVSFVLPERAMRDSMRGQGLSDRALAYRSSGDLDAAWRDASQAAELDPGSARVRFNLGVVAEARRDPASAEAAYLAALELNPPGRSAAAANLASLWIRGGAPGRAVAPLRRVLAEEPGNALCWNQLVVALYESGDRLAAAEATEDAERNDVVLDPGLVAAVRSGAARSGAPR